MHARVHCDVKESISSTQDFSPSSNDMALPTVETSDDLRMNIQFYGGCNDSNEQKSNEASNLDSYSPKSKKSSPSCGTFQDWFGSYFDCCVTRTDAIPQQTRSQEPPNMRDMIDDLLDHESPPRPLRRKQFRNDEQEQSWRTPEPFSMCEPSRVDSIDYDKTMK